MAYASDVDVSVTIPPSLNVTLSGLDAQGNVSLNLNPANSAFSSKDLTVAVGTNNPSGYTLTMTAPSTSLTSTEAISGVYSTISTLESEVAESNFTPNRWGYRFSDNTNTNFQPLPAVDQTAGTSSLPINESSQAVNNDTRTITFGAKVDTTQTPGDYELALTFVATAKPAPTYIQDFTKDMCQSEASSANKTVTDKRDNKTYNVRYINGNCWMTQNLRYVGDTGSASNYMTIKSATTNINTDKTLSYSDLTAGNDYSDARIHVGTDDAGGDTVWYNYAAASAGTITGDSNSTIATYDLCPKGWRLPTNSEQSGITSYSSAFSPVYGGFYYDGTLYRASTYGYWWSATVGSSTGRYSLRYYSGSLNTSSYGRDNGFYIRCIRSA